MIDRIDHTIFLGYKFNVNTDIFSLTEDNPNAKCRNAIIEKTGNIVVYKFDKTPIKNGTRIKDKFPFFNDAFPVHAMCDYILFYEKNPTNLYIIICNLKSDNQGNSSTQIEAGKIFAEFLIQTVKRCNPENFRDISIHYRKVLFSSKVIHKGATKYKKNIDKASLIRNYISNDEITQYCILDNICN